MRKVYKYELPIKDQVEIEMPEGAKPLSVVILTEETGTQRNLKVKTKLFLWALVNPNASLKIKHFRIAGTGYEINEDSFNFVGSAVGHNGKLVVHVFEVFK